MVSPPRVQGLNGTGANARTTNFMGTYSTASYIDSAINEDAGYSSPFAEKGDSFNSGRVCNTTFTNGDYTGDLWNFSGYVGKNGAMT